MTETTQRGLVTPSKGQSVGNSKDMLALWRQSIISVDAAIGGLGSVANLSPEALEAIANFDAETDLADAVIDARTRSGNRPIGQDEIVVNVKDYGAVGDGSTDDTDAIQAAIDAAGSAGDHVTVLFPGSDNGYRTTTKITVPHKVGLDMQGHILFAGTGTALEVGGLGASNRPSNVRQVIRVRRASQSDWSSESDIGVRLVNHYWSEIVVQEAVGFTIGVQCVGHAWGFAYNKVYLGMLAENHIAVDLDAVSSGWVNENSFYGGGFTVGTTVNNTQDRYGVRITSSDGSYTNNNSNVFYHPSFEIKNNPGTFTGTPVLAVHCGMGNKFLDCRHESPSPVAVITRNASLPVVYTTAYNTDNLSYDPQGTYAGTTIKEVSLGTAANARRLVFDTGPLHKIACYYNTNNLVNIPGLALVSSSTPDGTFYRRATNAVAVTINADYLEVLSSAYVGRFVSTKSVKEFVLFTDGDAGGRLTVRCYDSDGSILSAAGTIRSDVTTMGYTSSYGGAWRTQSDGTGPRYFRVSSAVERIFVGISGGTAAAQLRSFSLYAVSQRGTATTWLPWFEEGVNVGTAAPTSGTWEVGRRVMHAEPAAGSPQGWVCTVAGSPGTWVALPNL